jgi:hypothetical protein
MVEKVDKTASNYPPPALPVPDSWQVRPTTRKLIHSVRFAVETLYNALEDFRRLVATVGADDSVHGSRAFDCAMAAQMIQKYGKENRDPLLANAPLKKIWDCAYRVLTTENPNLRLKHRRQELLRLTAQPAA